MATRYWVGGTGTWNTSSTTNWSASTGGAAGASAPTSADDVVIDTSSGTGTITCTNAVCANLTVTASQAITLGAASSSLSVYGNLSFPSGGSFAASNTSFTITFAATATGKTITTNGKTLGGINFNGLGGGWTLSDALTTNGSTTGITISNGTFNTNGFSVSTGTITVGGGTTRVLTLGASSITCSSAWTVSSTTGFTLNANTSTITLSAAGTTFTGGGLTYYNVSFSSTSATTVIITGANTFNNLSFTSAATSSIKSITVGANQTVNGTLTANGGSEIRRFFIRSDTVGTARTITAAAESLSNCDFRDITAAGAASPFTGTGLGDCKGNTNITFPAAKTVYWNLGGTTTNWSATAWATSSGGSPSAANFPLAQDTAVIDNTGTVPSTAIQIESAWNIGTLNMSNRTSAVTITHPGVPTIYGDFTVGTGVSLTSTATLTFSGRTTQTITTAGKTFAFPVTIDSPGGTVQLNGNFTSSVAATSVALTLTRGTFDAVTYDLSLSQFSSSNTNTRTINMGSGTWTLYGTSQIWTTNTLTNLTLNKQTSNIVISNTSTTNKSFISGGNSLSFPKISFYLAGYTLIFTNAISMDELASIPFSTANTITFSTSTASTVGTWSVKGVSGTVPSITSASSGTTAIVNVTNKTTSDIDYLSFRDITCNTLDPVTFFVGSNSTNVSNNNGVAFTTNDYNIHVLASGTTWTVPASFNSSSNSVYLFGGGGGGSNGSASSNNRAGGAGGGGGGFTQLTNIPLTPSSSVPISIGAGGAAGVTGGVTQFIVNPITYIADAKTQNSSSGTSLVINKPTGTVDGDLMIAFVNSNQTGAGGWAGPAGWTQQYDFDGLGIYTKTASSEGSSYTFTSSSSTTLQGYILTYRYADFDLDGAQGTASATPSAPSITLTADNSYVIAYFRIPASSGVTYSTPTNYTAIDSDSDGTAPSSALFGRSNLSAGATGTVASTPSAGTTNRGILVGLKPASAYSAGGGSQGTASGSGQTSVGGAGGAGATYNGGTGGSGALGTTANTGYGGGGGGGAGGPNGIGKNGGNGFGSFTNGYGGGGGGGNGGGTNGGNASSGLGGNGGNNSLGTGGAAGGSGSGASGNFGGGGAGANGNNVGGNGGSGIDILNSFGGAGGKGGPGATASTANTGLYGGGGAGGGVTTAGVVQAGGAGSQGAIIIVYSSGTSYSVSITEDSIMGDSPSVLATFQAAISENTDLADSNSVLSAFAAALVENLNLDDSAAGDATYSVDITEVINSASAENGGSLYLVDITEDSILGDESIVGTALFASITEDLTALSIQDIAATFLSTISENADVADSSTVLSSFIAAVTENTTIADSPSGNVVFAISISEGTTVEDIASALISYGVTISENTGLLSVQIGGYEVGIVEATAVNDPQTGSYLIFAAVVENVSMLDGATAGANYTSNVSEAMVLSAINNVFGWTTINDDQTPNWVNVNNANASTWTNINDDQNPNWTVINNDQT